MKNTLIRILVLALALALFAASALAEPLAGGWEIAPNEAAALPEDVQAAFDRAVKDMDRAEYVPVALMATQIVAGVNYCILCQIVPVEPKAEASWALVYIYADPQGNAEITNVYELYIDRHSAPAEETDVESGIDYLALVNKLNPLPEGWEDALETVHITNSVGDDVEVERKAYDAYAALKADLEENDGIYLELDSARRSVAAQQDIMDRFIEKYGADYAAKTVATPGYSEHHTGLALDLYFRIRGDDGAFTDVYYNEDMMKPEYTGIWDAIHAKLADYGFILRYPEGKEHITGYGYEPWHIRYVDSVEIAREIMSRPGTTLESWLGAVNDPELTIDYRTSELYSREELDEAIVQIKCKFASFAGCELHALRYAGDACDSEENLEWLNSLDEGGEYVQAVEFLSDFHSPVEDGPYAWEQDAEYTDYQWWLARTEDGGWQLLSWGY